MNTRTNFVTIDVKSNILEEIFKENLLDFAKDIITWDDGSISLKFENVDFYIPNDKSDIINSLIIFLQANYEDMTDICNMLNTNREKVLNSISFFKIESVEYNNDKTDNEKFYEDSYSKKVIKKIKKAIAKELDCSVKKVTYEDFCNYVACAESVCTETYVYDRLNDNNKYKKVFDIVTDNYNYNE